MYNSSGLIPVKFLILISHFAICVSLLWGSQQSVRSCLMDMEQISEEVFASYHSQMVIGLSVAIGLICFEMLAFLVGITMFHSTSALFSVGCHTLGCVVLANMVIDNWQCGWFWWIFSIGSALPAMNDITIVLDVLVNKKY